MSQPKLTLEARCLVILAGGVLERCIENRAGLITAGRSGTEITPEDVRTASEEFLREELSDLPHLIEVAIKDHWQGLTQVA